jgi:hypothetical protein
MASRTVRKHNPEQCVYMLMHGIKFWGVRCALLLALGGIASVSGQLIPSGMPLPRTAKPPVVFLNGYQLDCSSSSFSGSFGIADQVLESNGEVSVFFNNCMVAGKPPLETLARPLARFCPT